MRRRPRHDGPEHAAGQQRERRLHRVDVADRLAAVELFHVEVADPDPACLALVHELGHRPPGLFEQRPGRPVGPVHLVEVDALQAEAMQAELALLADRLGAEIVPDEALRAAFPPPPALREDEDLLTGSVRPEGAPHDLFGAAEAVHGRRVDPVDPELHRAPDRRDGLVVVDLSPAEPPGPSDRPGAEPHDAQIGPGATESPCVHARITGSLRPRASSNSVPRASQSGGISWVPTRTRRRIILLLVGVIPRPVMSRVYDRAMSRRRS